MIIPRLRMTRVSRLFGQLLCLTLLLVLAGPVRADVGRGALEGGGSTPVPGQTVHASGPWASSALLPIPVVVPTILAESRCAEESETESSSGQRPTRSMSRVLPQRDAGTHDAPGTSLLTLFCVLRC